MLKNKQTKFKIKSQILKRAFIEKINNIIKIELHLHKNDYGEYNIKEFDRCFFEIRDEKRSELIQIDFDKKFFDKKINYAFLKEQTHDYFDSNVIYLYYVPENLINVKKEKIPLV